MATRLPQPSAHDVARLAGVSQAAVSRAFTPGASIATATREKVLEAAKALRYRPNLVARSLIMGKSAIIGVVIGDHRYPFLTVILSALSAHLSRAGKRILVHAAEGEANLDVHVEALLNYRVDALLLLAANISPALAKQCRLLGVPGICLGRPTFKKGSFPCVTGDNVTGGARIAEHLLLQGYRRFAFIGGGREPASHPHRESGFTDYLLSQGMSAPERAECNMLREGTLVATRSLLSMSPRPDAIFCANDDMALAAIDVARYEFGLAIGRELGVAGFDDIEQAAWPSFDLTTYAQPVDQLVERAVEILLGTSPAAVQPQTIVGGSLKIRGSTRRS